MTNGRNDFLRKIISGRQRRDKEKERRLLIPRKQGGSYNGLDLDVISGDKRKLRARLDCSFDCPSWRLTADGSFVLKSHLNVDWRQRKGNGGGEQSETPSLDR